jgi:excisionase family DNA binding protein
VSEPAFIVQTTAREFFDARENVPTNDGAGRMSSNGKPTLAETMQAFEAAVSSAPLAEIPSLLGFLEKAKALSWTRMLAEQQQAQPETTAKPTLLTAQQVAERLSVPRSFVYESARQGKLKPVKLGEKYVRFTQDTVDDYLTKSGA